MMMSLLERLNHAFSGGIMFVQPTAVNAKNNKDLMVNADVQLFTNI